MRFLPVPFLCVLAGGCLDWEYLEVTRNAVWSDDDASWVYVVESFDRREDNNFMYQYRRTRWTLWLEDVDSGERTKLLERKEDDHLGKPTYFSSVGRILLFQSCVEVLDVDVETREVRTVAEAVKCDIRDAVADPTGEFVALTTQPPLGGPTTLTMLDWETLEPIWGPEEVPRAKAFGWWTPEGNYFVGPSIDDGSVAYLWSPDGTISLVPRPECRPPRAPPTSSSRISADGVQLCSGLDGVEFCTQEQIDKNWELYNPSIPLLPFGCPDGAP